jgi:Ca2+-transporting ATPase
MSSQACKTKTNNLWHNLSIDDVMHLLDTRASGLSSDEVAQRLKEFGHNRLRVKKKGGALSIFLRQFINPLIFILIAASGFKFFLDKPLDAIVVSATVFIMIMIGFFQEMRAERAMQSLKKLYWPTSKVKRDHQFQIIASEDIVPGDLIFLESGDRIPCDGRIIDCNRFTVNESSLTGESATVEKNSGYSQDQAPLAERRNMVYTGTCVATGKACVICVATAMETELGKIAQAIQDIKPERTPLQKSIHSLTVWMSCIVFTIIGIFFLICYVKGLSWVEMILFSISAAIAAIPEGLPAAVTIVLATGMYTMGQRNALIRRLAAVETLGSTTLIASDKTGTLTCNQMQVQEVFVFQSNPDKEKLLYQIAVLANDASVSKKGDAYEIMGDPTEASLLIAAENYGIDHTKMIQSMPRIHEIPFESHQRFMATLCHCSLQKQAFVKGAPEKLLSLSSLSEDDKNDIEKQIERLSQQGFRLLAAGHVPTFEGDLLTEESLEGQVEFIGLFAMQDPPRKEAIQAIQSCKNAGIRVVMITGDNKTTAEAIAKELGIDTSHGSISSEQIDTLDDATLKKIIHKVNIFARIEPLHKLKIVKAFKELHYVVAMTGDGVNDAPALEAADIGIAMGINGTDVAKEASDMILIDDNFSSITAAVEEGRAIFNRLRSVTTFLLTTCVGELLGLIISISFTQHVFLLPLQILWINLVTGVIIAIPLALEPKSGRELLQPPRSTDVKLVYPGMVCRIIFLASQLAIFTSIIYIIMLQFHDLKVARTMVFCSVVIFEWMIAFNMRSEEKTIFELGFFSNRALLLPISIGILLQLSILYIPVLQSAFQTVPLSLSQWLIVTIPGIVIFTIETLGKMILPNIFSFGCWKRGQKT